MSILSNSSSKLSDGDRCSCHRLYAKFRERPELRSISMTQTWAKSRDLHMPSPSSRTKTDADPTRGVHVNFYG
jgi:hypothetical protein